MAADDRYSIAGCGCPHAGQHGGGTCFAVRPDGIDHRDRPAAHCGDIGNIHHHAAPAGKPRLGRDEFVHEAFDGEKQIAVAVRQGCAVVSHRNVAAGKAKGAADRADIGFRSNAGRCCKSCRKGGYVDCRPGHAALLGSATKPASGVEQGGYHARSAFILRCGLP